jgi:hypothetical protein
MYILIVNKKSFVELDYYSDAITLAKSLRDNNETHLQILSYGNSYTSLIKHDDILRLLDKETQQTKNDTPNESMPF